MPKLIHKNRKKFLLLTPGPINVAGNVRTAVAHEDIGHREIEFEQLHRNIEKRLLQLFEIRNERNFQAVVITGSGSAANEAMLSSVVGQQNILIISNGEFGERLYELSKIHNKNTFLLRFPWGQPLDLDVVRAHLQERQIDVIALVHHETSTGMLNPLAQIGALARESKSIFLVDCVSSTGAELIDMERDNIAFCSGSSSKAIGSYPGLSFVIGNILEFEKLRELPAKTAYLSLYKFFKFARDKAQTPNTPAVPLFFALDQALINILKESAPSRRSKILRTANKLRRGMTNLGLTFLLDDDDMCSVLTTVNLPSNLDIGELRRQLRKESIIIYEGKGSLKGLVFQVGNIGELSEIDVANYLKVLGNFLHKLQVNKLTIGTNSADLPLQHTPPPSIVTAAMGDVRPVDRGPHGI